MSSSVGNSALGMFRSVFLGPPGAGKGTQAQQLAGRDDVLHISTGDMLREHVKGGTELGVQAKGFMDAGNLVPDDLIIAMVEERLARPDADGKSWILDGFPRTLAQAEALDGSLKGSPRELTHVVYFDVPMDALLMRLTGRRTCGSCGAIWNIHYKPTTKEGICDKCGGDLTQRADDTEEAVGQRLQQYQDLTAPLLQFYRDGGRLAELAADRDPAEVFQGLIAALGGRS